MDGTDTGTVVTTLNQRRAKLSAFMATPSNYCIVLFGTMDIKSLNLETFRTALEPSGSGLNLR